MPHGAKACNENMSVLNPRQDQPDHAAAVDPQTLLSTLEDPVCRTILEAATEEWLTAPEISERCDVPCSTTYRKVERLAESGLIEESVRISSTGHHATGYRTAFEDVTIGVSESGDLEVDVSRTSAPGAAAD